MLTKAQKIANRRRAERGVAMILEYKKRYDKDEPTETALTDLLADLKHAVRDMAGRKDPNGYLMWMRLDQRAHGHFICEVDGVG